MEPQEIYTRRRERGLTQLALGEQVGVGQATISNWESGKGRRPNKVQTERLRAVLVGTDIAGGEISPTRPEYESAPVEYGEWLSQTRIDHGLSRAELAAKAGISAPQIFNIETGRTANPQAATRRKLEDALGAKPTDKLVEAVRQEALIEDVGEFVDFDPHVKEQHPDDPGVYVFYDISDRPIYIGQSQNIRRRITDHLPAFWYKVPIVEKASYVRVADQKLRRQLENTLIKFLKSNAVINRQQVEGRE